jgi:hypothetical protein
MIHEKPPEKPPVKLNPAQKKDLRDAIKRMEKDFHKRVADHAASRVKELFPDLMKREADLEQARKHFFTAMDSKTPVFTDEEYKTILRCLHPDSRLSVSSDILAKAFTAFTRKEKHLTFPKKGT